MSNMELTVNVEVSLKEATIQSIGKMFAACLGGATSAPKPLPPTVETRPAAPAPRPEIPAKPEAAPEPKAPEIDNMTLNKAVKDAQARGVEADVIRGVFAKYGIKSSRECPTDKRPALLAELNDLKADMPA